MHSATTASPPTRRRLTGRANDRRNHLHGCGYLPVTRTWASGDVLRLSLPLQVRRVYSDPKVSANQGRVAIARGPIVYCLESNDNGTPVHKIVIPSGASLSASYDGGLLGGVTKITGTGQHADNGSPVGFTMIPYGVWDNRTYDSSQMTVMVPETTGAATPPVDRNRVGNATVTWSYKNPSDSETAVNDGIIPGDPNTIPRFTWWDHRGTKEWVQYDFPRPERLSSAEVYWWDERRINAHCRVPKSWRLLYRTADGWLPVPGASAYGTEMDRFNRVTFDSVETKSLRLEVELQPEWSGGILEWRVDQHQSACLAWRQQRAECLPTVPKVNADLAVAME